MWRQQIAITLILLGATSAALADPPAGKPAPKPKTLTAAQAVNEAQPGGPDQQAVVKAMQGALQRANRDQHREQRSQELHARLHGRELSAPIRAELRNHARRLSRLLRVRRLAVTTDAALLPRIDTLVARETARHDARLSLLIAQSKPAAPTSPDDHESDDEVEE